MKLELISFQKRAIIALRKYLRVLQNNYLQLKEPQVVSLQAPTGAGKTIIAAALIEDVYCGARHECDDYPAQPNAIFVWLSDSPELNEQSRQKIELKTSHLRYGQCVAISEDSFDMEELEDGHIYFLNTQKLSSTSKLTKRSDMRQYTIWETLDNTIQNKADRLYFIIDEAHRGAKSKREAGRDTTIMQRFIVGHKWIEDGVMREMRPMPVILGISATAKRFNTLVESVTIGSQSYVITADEVRHSGLLKERIVITYPEDDEKHNDFVLLEAATREWMQKCERWHHYTVDQHCANVDPVFVIQVCAGHNGALSDTNLEDVLTKIEECCGRKFALGEVVHSFGEGSNLEINGLKIPYVKASEIASDHTIKIVFFKEALSTGWDCPRAETMMSFAVRNDPTYIAQLLGRMVRTPLQRRVMSDDTLNEVRLYLPDFNRESVKGVIDELLSNEGGDIPTEINGESLREPTYVTWTTRPLTRRNNPDDPRQDSLFNYRSGIGAVDGSPGAEPLKEDVSPEEPYVVVPNPLPTGRPPEDPNPPQPPYEPEELPIVDGINREEILNFINSQGYLTYSVQKRRPVGHLKSLMDMASLLMLHGIYQDACREVTDGVMKMISGYVELLRARGNYAKEAEKIQNFKLNVQVFDPFGERVCDKYSSDFSLISESDLDRQLAEAELKLGQFGFTNSYGHKFYDENNPNQHKIDCILFATDEECLARLDTHAKMKFDEFVNTYRLKVVNGTEECKRKYREIVANSARVSEQMLSLPETVSLTGENEGIEYKNHLYISEATGSAKIKLNSSWEQELLEEEAVRPDFICWLRNTPQTAWALCLPYEVNGETKCFYPDFLIVRQGGAEGPKYIIDILEPHGSHFADSLYKAKALAKYASKEDRLGRIQLIAKDLGSNFRRLDLADITIREIVEKMMTIEELTHLFGQKEFSKGVISLGN